MSLSAPRPTESWATPPTPIPGRVSLEDTLVKNHKLEMAAELSSSSNFWKVLWRKTMFGKERFYYQMQILAVITLMMLGEHLKKNIYF